VIDTTPAALRTPVSQRHCRRDPDQLIEPATAAREVAADPDDTVK
jgi:hypothetical protein